MPAGVTAALIVIVCALYAQTAGFEFVTLDDHRFIIDNPHVRDGLTTEGVRWALTALSPNWHPITWWVAHARLSALRTATGGTSPGQRRAVHPLRAESVAWLSERKDVMSGLFWMLALLAYAVYARRPSAARYLLVALALGLLAKTILVTLPLVLLLLDCWPLRRWTPPGMSPSGGAAGAQSATGTRVLLEKLPLLALSIAASAVTVRVQQTVEGMRSLAEVPLLWRLLNVPVAYVVYLRKTVWPVDLAALYPHPALLAARALEGEAWRAAGAALLLLAISAAGVAQRRQRPYLLIGWLWYLIVLVPVIGWCRSACRRTPTATPTCRRSVSPSCSPGGWLRWPRAGRAPDRCWSSLQAQRSLRSPC